MSVIKYMASKSVISILFVSLLAGVTHQCLSATGLVYQQTKHAEEILPDTAVEQSELILRMPPDEDVGLSSIIKRKQRFYADTFPEIQFIVLQGGEAWLEDFEALSVLLGPEPISLDYEHTPDLREDLMYVSLERIRMMLANDAPSASLLRADEPMGWREKLCVITINPAAIAENNRIATHYLIEPYYEIRGKIKQENLVDRKEFLEYVFDHEAYHCLESDFIGPQPMSYLEFWADYYDYRHENGADAFAIAMHIKRHQSVTEFVKKIMLIRGLSLYCDDCNHWTQRVIRQVSESDTLSLISMDTMDLFRYASSLRDDIAQDYKDYLQYRSNAKEVCGILNSKLWNDENDKLLPSPDPETVNDMLDIFRNYYLELTGTEFVEP